MFEQAKQGEEQYNIRNTGNQKIIMKIKQTSLLKGISFRGICQTIFAILNILQEIISSYRKAPNMTSQPQNPKPNMVQAFNPIKYTSLLRTQEQALMAKEIFNHLCDDIGRLTVWEFRKVMRQMGYQFYSSVFIDLDTDKPMTIDFEEFLDVMIPDMRSRNYLYRIFMIFDRQRTGKISLRDLKAIAKEIGEEISQEQLKEMIKMGKQAEGYISSQEFYCIMTKNLRE